MPPANRSRSQSRSQSRSKTAREQQSSDTPAHSAHATGENTQDTGQEAKQQGPDASYDEAQAKLAAAGVAPSPLSSGGGISGAINVDSHDEKGTDSDNENGE